jgi:hypothetical protein
MTQAELKHAIENLANTLHDLLGGPVATTPTVNDRLTQLAWTLQDANENAGTPGVGACRYTDAGGVSHCCNLTKAQCSQIPGSTFDPSHPCPVQVPGVDTVGPPVPAVAAARRLRPGREADRRSGWARRTFRPERARCSRPVPWQLGRRSITS